MWVKPIDWILEIIEETQMALTHKDVNRVLYRHRLSLPNSLLENLNLNWPVTQILSKADMQDVTRQNVAELRRHINLDALVVTLVNLGGPLSEGVDEFNLERLEHMLKPVLVESVCTSLSLCLPHLVIPRRDERVANDVLE